MCWLLEIAQSAGTSQGVFQLGTCISFQLHDHVKKDKNVPFSSASAMFNKIK